MRHPQLYIIIVISCFVIASCVNSEEYKKIKEEFRDVEFTGNVKGFDSIYATIPDYSEISATINKLHIGFSSENLLDPNSANNYFNSKETSIALGMYIADLGYARHYERVQYCSDYLEAVKTLCEKLAIGEKEFLDAVPMIESNLDDREVLFSVVDSLISKGDVLLSANEKFGIGALFLAGFWIETTYLGLSVQNIKDTAFVNPILMSHFEILKQVNKLFFCLDDNSQLSDIKTSLQTIESKGINNKDLLKDIVIIRDKYRK
ncbi:MAG TPA: hypothetical protein PLL66_03620 [Bacteroidales bacterium]|nr:hypothetical protein [Bacteroidales bacterium]